MPTTKHLDTDMGARAPDKDIACKECVFRLDGKNGYTNSYCRMFTEFPGKPLEILYRHAPCQYRTEATGE